MDTSVKPGDDFFRYANGKWLDSFEIPADRSRYGAFDQLAEAAEQDVHAIIEELAAGSPAPGSVEQKVADFYKSWMDAEQIASLGTEPLQAPLAEIDAVASHDDLMKQFGASNRAAPLGLSMEADPADTTRYIMFVGQSGLGLPNRDYYLRDDERFVGYRKAYREYIAKLFELAGIDGGEAKADAIIALETQIAQAHWTPERSRNIEETYNPMRLAEVKKLAPGFAWDPLLAEAGLGAVENFVIEQTTAITESGSLTRSVPLNTWKDYLKFHFINDSAAYLPKPFDDASFEMFGKTLSGQPEQRERWKRGVQLLNRSMGEAVGEVYVERHFPPEARAQITELVSNLRAAMEERLETLEWMDDETRQAAQVKLGTFDPRVGYPNKWIDYSPLEIKSDDLLGNVLRSREFDWNEELKRLNGPVDRDLWGMNPQTVNAYYHPLMNQITFPAAILQAPFFDPAADPAINYGAIGGVIGHEIGHGFDDQGRKFDEKGLIRDWWTETSNERFTARSTMLGKQYDAFEPIEGLHVNGQLTMGENIGDLGGLQMAYAAYQRYVAENGEPPVIDGFTGDQRFFLSWAQVWRAKMREDAARRQIVTDPHSPPQERVNGVVRNLDAWYEAFDVTEGNKLYLPPDQRVRIW
jgi:endothelin-converting enzyme/putative endopeptidase